MKRLTTRITFLLLILSLSAGSAVAATINVNYSLSNGEAISYTLDSADIKDTYGLEFSPINLDFDMDGSYDLSTIAYCVELTQGVGNDDTYPVDLITASGNYLAAAWIMDNYAGSSNAAQNAAVQVAIWETVYDGIGGSLTDGRFTLTTSSTTVLTLAAQYITDLTSASLAGLERYMIAVNPDKQDLLVTVPVPAAVWLFGSGLLGLIGFRKRSNRS